MENVTGLLSQGLDQVLSDLAACGYDAEWDCLPASGFGAPHERDRIWIVAYPTVGPTRREGSAFDRSGWGDDSTTSSKIGDSELQGLERFFNSRQSEIPEPGYTSWWATEPGVCRMADGVPNRVDRLKALGNSLVPQIAELIGSRIVRYERED